MKRNFVGEKDLSRKPAAFRIASEVVKSKNEGSIKKVANAVKHLANFAKEELGLKNLAKLTKEDMADFAEHLREKVTEEEISRAHATNIISALNTVFNHYGRDDLKLSAKEKELNRGSKIDNINKSLSEEIHNKLSNYLSNKYNQTNDVRFEALRLQIELQRDLGLRFKESALSDLKNVSYKSSTIQIEKGTKGGQSRKVHISEKAIQTIKEAKSFRQSNDFKKSMIPDNMDFRKWTKFAYNTIKIFNDKYNVNFNFHSERHSYAQNRYFELTSVQAPVIVNMFKEEHIKYIAETLNISIDEAKKLDISARMEISEELGHHRLEITSVYLGR